MRIPTWRLILTGGALVILAAAGIGLVSAADPAAPATPASELAAPDRDAAAQPDRRDRVPERLRDHPRFLRNLVHAEITVDHPDAGLITIQLDRGTIKAIGASSLTISEAGGSTVVVKTDDETRVRIGRQRGSLDDLQVGDDVFVQSRVDGSVLAKRIVVIPAD